MAKGKVVRYGPYHAEPTPKFATPFVPDIEAKLRKRVRDLESEVNELHKLLFWIRKDLDYIKKNARMDAVDIPF